MSIRFKPYPAYTESGVPWLGQVPEHWKVRRLGDSVSGCINGVWGDEPNGRNDLVCVRVADFDRWRFRVRLATPTMRAIAPNERRRRVLEKGDMLLEKSGGGDTQPVGAVVLFDHDAPAVCSNFVARMPLADGFNPAYVTYLHAYLYAIRLNVRSIKQTTGIQNLDSSSYLRELTAFPPVAEQTAIVRYLEIMDDRIRRYIRTKQTLLRLQSERRQVATHEALRLRGTHEMRLCEVATRDRQPIERQNDRVYTPIGMLNRGRGIFHKIPVLGAELGDSTFFALEEGDLVLSGQFAWEGAIAIATREDEGCVASHRYPLLRGRPGLAESGYLLSYLQTPMGHLLVDHHSRGAAGRNRPLNPRTLMKERIPIPPLTAQQHISDMVRLEADLRRTTAKAVELLAEYRNRLIAELVTGKLDVREAADHFKEMGELEPVECEESLDVTDPAVSEVEEVILEGAET